MAVGPRPAGMGLLDTPRPDIRLLANPSSSASPSARRTAVYRSGSQRRNLSSTTTSIPASLPILPSWGFGYFSDVFLVLRPDADNAASTALSRTCAQPALFTMTTSLDRVASLAVLVAKGQVQSAPLRRARLQSDLPPRLAPPCLCFPAVPCQPVTHPSSTHLISHINLSENCASIPHCMVCSDIDYARPASSTSHSLPLSLPHHNRWFRWFLGQTTLLQFSSRQACISS